MLDRDAPDTNVEIGALQRVQGHPNVIGLMGRVEYASDVAFIMLEYCEGGDLLETILAAPEQRLNEDMASFFFAQICRAVRHCHKNNIYHLDIKPENILLKHAIQMFDYELSYPSSEPALEDNSNECTVDEGAAHGEGLGYGEGSKGPKEESTASSSSATTSASSSVTTTRTASPVAPPHTTTTTTTTTTSTNTTSVTATHTTDPASSSTASAAPSAAPSAAVSAAGSGHPASLPRLAIQRIPSGLWNTKPTMVRSPPVYSGDYPPHSSTPFGSKSPLPARTGTPVAGTTTAPGAPPRPEMFGRSLASPVPAAAAPGAQKYASKGHQFLSASAGKYQPSSLSNVVPVRDAVSTSSSSSSASSVASGVHTADEAEICALEHTAAEQAAASRNLLTGGAAPSTHGVTEATAATTATEQTANDGELQSSRSSAISGESSDSGHTSMDPRLSDESGEQSRTIDPALVRNVHAIHNDEPAYMQQEIRLCDFGSASFNRRSSKASGSIFYAAPEVVKLIAPHSEMTPVAPNTTAQMASLFSDFLNREGRLRPDKPSVHPSVHAGVYGAGSVSSAGSSSVTSDSQGYSGPFAFDAAAADIWSLGVLLFTMVAGYPPFKEASMYDTNFVKLATGGFRFPEHFSKDLIRLLSSMLRIRPRERGTLADVYRDSWVTPFNPLRRSLHRLWTKRTRHVRRLPQAPLRPYERLHGRLRRDFDDFRDAKSSALLSSHPLRPPRGRSADSMLSKDHTSKPHRGDDEFVGNGTSPVTRTSTPSLSSPALPTPLRQPPSASPPATAVPGLEVRNPRGSAPVGGSGGSRSGGIGGVGSGGSGTGDQYTPVSKRSGDASSSPLPDDTSFPSSASVSSTRVHYYSPIALRSLSEQSFPARGDFFTPDAPSATVSPEFPASGRSSEIYEASAAADHDLGSQWTPGGSYQPQHQPQPQHRHRRSTGGESMGESGGAMPNRRSQRLSAELPYFPGAPSHLLADEIYQALHNRRGSLISNFSDSDSSSSLDSPYRSIGSRSAVSKRGASSALSNTTPALHGRSGGSHLDRTIVNALSPVPSLDSGLQDAKRSHSDSKPEASGDGSAQSHARAKADSVGECEELTLGPAIESHRHSLRKSLLSNPHSMSMYHIKPPNAYKNQHQGPAKLLEAIQGKYSPDIGTPGQLQNLMRSTQSTSTNGNNTTAAATSETTAYHPTPTDPVTSPVFHPPSTTPGAASVTSAPATGAADPAASSSSSSSVSSAGASSGPSAAFVASSSSASPIASVAAPATVSAGGSKAAVSALNGKSKNGSSDRAKDASKDASAHSKAVSGPFLRSRKRRTGPPRLRRALSEDTNLIVALARERHREEASALRQLMKLGLLEPQEASEQMDPMEQMQHLGGLALHPLKQSKSTYNTPLLGGLAGSPFPGSLPALNIGAAKADSSFLIGSADTAKSPLDGSHSTDFHSLRIRPARGHVASMQPVSSASILRLSDHPTSAYSSASSTTRYSAHADEPSSVPMSEPILGMTTPKPFGTLPPFLRGLGSDKSSDPGSSTSSSMSNAADPTASATSTATIHGANPTNHTIPTGTATIPDTLSFPTLSSPSTAFAPGSATSVGTGGSSQSGQATHASLASLDKPADKSADKLPSAADLRPPQLAPIFDDSALPFILDARRREAMETAPIRIPGKPMLPPQFNALVEQADSASKIYAHLKQSETGSLSLSLAPLSQLGSSTADTISSAPTPASHTPLHSTHSSHTSSASFASPLSLRSPGQLPLGLSPLTAPATTPGPNSATGSISATGASPCTTTHTGASSAHFGADAFPGSGGGGGGGFGLRINVRPTPPPDTGSGSGFLPPPSEADVLDDLAAELASLPDERNALVGKPPMRYTPSPGKFLRPGAGTTATGVSVSSGASSASAGGANVSIAPSRMPSHSLPLPTRGKLHKDTAPALARHAISTATAAPATALATATASGSVSASATVTPAPSISGTVTGGLPSEVPPLKLTIQLPAKTVEKVDKVVEMAAGMKAAEKAVEKAAKEINPVESTVVADGDAAKVPAVAEVVAPVSKKEIPSKVVLGQVQDAAAASSTGKPEPKPVPSKETKVSVPTELSQPEDSPSSVPLAEFRTDSKKATPAPAFDAVDLTEGSEKPSLASIVAGAAELTAAMAPLLRPTLNIKARRGTFEDHEEEAPQDNRAAATMALAASLPSQGIVSVTAEVTAPVSATPPPTMPHARTHHITKSVSFSPEGLTPATTVSASSSSVVADDDSTSNGSRNPLPPTSLQPTLHHHHHQQQQPANSVFDALSDLNKPSLVTVTSPDIKLTLRRQCFSAPCSPTFPSLTTPLHSTSSGINKYSPASTDSVRAPTIQETSESPYNSSVSSASSTSSSSSSGFSPIHYKRTKVLSPPTNMAMAHAATSATSPFSPSAVSLHSASSSMSLTPHLVPLSPIYSAAVLRGNTPSPVPLASTPVVNSYSPPHVVSALPQLHLAPAHPLASPIAQNAAQSAIQTPVQSFSGSWITLHEEDMEALPSSSVLPFANTSAPATKQYPSNARPFSSILDSQKAPKLPAGFANELRPNNMRNSKVREGLVLENVELVSLPSTRFRRNKRAEHRGKRRKKAARGNDYFIHGDFVITNDNYGGRKFNLSKRITPSSYFYLSNNVNYFDELLEPIHKGQLDVSEQNDLLNSEKLFGNNSKRFQIATLKYDSELSDQDDDVDDDFDDEFDSAASDFESDFADSDFSDGLSGSEYSYETAYNRYISQQLHQTYEGAEPVSQGFTSYYDGSPTNQ